MKMKIINTFLHSCLPHLYTTSNTYCLPNVYTVHTASSLMFQIMNHKFCIACDFLDFFYIFKCDIFPLIVQCTQNNTFSPIPVAS